MRQAINENPLVQIAVLAGAAIVLAVVFLMQMGGGSEEAAPPPAAQAPAAATPSQGSRGSASAGQASAVPGSATGSAPATTEPVTPAPAAGDAGNEGLPTEYVRASESGRPVAIFVVQDKPVSDKVVGGYADQLRASGQAEVFVIAPDEMAEWVRVVGPAGVDRTPALVVVGPAKGGAQPTAAASYGFRNYESVEQAVKDATYDGPVGGYDPG